VALSTMIRRVELGGTVSVVETRIDGGTYDGQEMPSVAPTRATILARVPLMNRWSLGLDGRFTSSRRFEGDFADKFGTQDAFFVLDAKVTYTQRRGRLFVDLKNLFNEEYDEYGVLGGFPIQRSFYPSPGFHALVGVELTY
jgi:outer membrane receptor protein involved in Fe transport